MGTLAKYMTMLKGQSNSIVLLRNIAILSQIAVIAFVILFLNIKLNLAAMSAIIGIELAFNLYCWLKFKSIIELTAWQQFSQLVVDTLFLAALLYFSGGARNPFVSLFLIPIAFSAVSLNQRYTWFLVVLSVILYSILMYFFVPIHSHVDSDIHSFDLHIIGMWVNFILSASLISFFVLNIAKTLREKEKVIQHQREKALQKENLVAIGTLAANAAHEMGTPLSSLMLLASELQEADTDNEDLLLLKSQIERCRDIVTNLGGDAQHILNGHKFKYQIDEYDHLLIDQLNLIRPEIKITSLIDEELATKTIEVDKMLLQSLLTILNNAAEASIGAKQNKIDIHWRLEDCFVVIEVRDHGIGVAQELTEKIGKTQVSNKASGLGLGLLLANASIERFKGKVVLENHPEQGAVTRVYLQSQAIALQ